MTDTNDQLTARYLEEREAAGREQRAKDKATARAKCEHCNTCGDHREVYHARSSPRRPDSSSPSEPHECARTARSKSRSTRYQ